MSEDRPLNEEVQEAIARHKTARSSRAWFPILTVVTIVSLMTASVFATLFWARSERAVSTLSQSNDAQRQQFITCQQLPRTDPRCKTPVAPPATKIIEVPTTVQITPEPIAPSQEQVQQAVDAYCTGGRCGKGPTPQQVAAAVTAYCNARGQCTPKPITPSPGKDGTPGQDGKNASSVMVAEAVANYCNQTSKPCKSDVPGADGKNGRGISSVTTEVVTGGTKVTINFDDGTTPVSFVVKDGADGAVGPSGPPGPACPTDATLEARWVTPQGTLSSIETPESELVYICVKH